MKGRPAFYQWRPGFRPIGRGETRFVYQGTGGGISGLGLSPSSSAPGLGPPQSRALSRRLVRDEVFVMSTSSIIRTLMLAHTAETRKRKIRVIHHQHIQKNEWVVRRQGLEPRTCRLEVCSILLS